MKCKECNRSLATNGDKCWDCMDAQLRLNSREIVSVEARNAMQGGRGNPGEGADGLGAPATTALRYIISDEERRLAWARS